MLRRIEVSGFKSLVDFELEFRPGLNVLAGPNGAGKSNIIKFLEFLSDTADGDLSRAFSRLGGAGEVSYRGMDGKLGSAIKFSVEGSVKLKLHSNIEKGMFGTTMRH